MDLCGRMDDCSADPVCCPAESPVVGGKLRRHFALKCRRCERN